MIPPPRTTSRRGTSVWASRPVESTQRGESRPGIGGRIGYEPVATIALLKVTSSAPSTAIVVGPVNVPVALDPLDAVRLEERGDAAGHLLDDAVLPGGDRGEVERRLADLRRRASRTSPARRGSACALCTHALVGMQPDAQAGAAERGLLLDAHDLAAELGGADRGRVPGRAASEDGDVDIHSVRPFVSVVAMTPRLGEHRDGVVALADLLEAVALVELDRARVGAVDAERDRGVAVRPRPLEQRVDERPADALAARVRDDGDRQLRRLLVDEPVPGPVACRTAGTRRRRPGSPSSIAITAVSPGPPPRLDVERDRARAPCRVRAPSSSTRGGACRAGSARPARRLAGRRRRRLRRSQRERRLLDERDERLQELGAVCAVDRPVVARQGQVHDRRDVELAVATTASSFTAPTARIATCGGLSTAVNCSTPNMPRLEIVNVPPSRSGERQLAVARAADEIGPGAGDLLHACCGRRRGSPARRGPAALRRRSRRSRARVAVDLLAGEGRVDGRWRTSATATSLTSTSFTVGFTSPSASRSTSCSRSASASVMSAETPSWKTGADHASVRRRAIVLRIDGELHDLDLGRRPGATAAAGAAARRSGGGAFSTSSARIRPSGPGARRAPPGRPRARARSGGRAGMP